MIPASELIPEASRQTGTERLWHSVTKAGNISSQYVGINTLRVWPQRVATWLGLPNPISYSARLTL